MNNRGNNGFNIGLIAGVIFLVLTLLSSVFLFRMTTISGSQMAVVETLTGISDQPVGPSTQFYVPLIKTYYKYDMTTQIFVMNNTESKRGEKGKGRETDSYLVQSKDQQDMHISLSVRWKFDPTKILHVHKTYNAHIGNDDNQIMEERLIRNTVMRTVKNHATVMKAIEAYADEGLVRLQASIEKDLIDPTGELRSNGVIVENFVIERIDLDSSYVAEIKARQIAGQKQLRAVEEQKAAVAEAEKVKAEAMADLNKQVVAAQRDKEVALLKAEQLAGAQVKAAEAQKEQVVLAAQGEKEAGENRAAAIIAIGRAEAEAQKLRLSAYSVPGSDNFTRIQIANSMATAFSNIKGYMPQGMTVNLLSSNFTDAIENLLKGPVAK